MISVAMTTYNGEKYLEEQLDSILNQTIQDFEIIVCDDCSTDKTWNILLKYQEKDKRIKIFKNDSNIGFKKNFENAIYKCQGEYIALSDQDDIWMKDHLEILITNMSDSVQLVCGNSVVIDEKGDDLGFSYRYIYGLDNILYDNLDIARHILLHANSYLGCSMLFRKDFFNYALPIPDEIDYHDSWFACLACFMQGMVYVDIPIMKYRRHSGEVTATRIRKSAIREFIGKTLFNHSGLDKMDHVKGVKNRLTSISPEYEKELLLIEKMLKRRNTFIGRLLNIPYLLKYFKVVFTCDRRRLFKS